MSTGQGGPDESGKDMTNGAQQRSGPAASWIAAHVPEPWRRPRRLLIMAALLVVIVVIIVTRPAATPSHPAPGTTVFPVGNQVVLRFVHSAGSVHVSAGQAGQVRITEHRNGITSAIHTNYRQQGNVITVTVSIENGLFTATWVDFNVAVPQGSTARVAVAAGTLDANGLNGNFALDDSNGSIWATNMSGAVAMHTTSGSINTDRVNGQVSASTGNGTITSMATRLSGNSVVQAQSGTINFHGSLDPGSHATFRNTNGATGVTLPSGSSVRVAARTPLGSINSQFPSVRVVSNSDGRVASGSIGRGPLARLTIQTKGGSIALNHVP
jgi:hypothetical protein